MKKLQILILFIITIVMFWNCSEGPTYNNPYDSDMEPEKWKPKNLSLSQENIDTVKLEWEQEFEQIGGFKIEHRTEQTDEWDEIADLDKARRQFIDDSAVLNQRNYYQIYAYADENNSKYISGNIEPEFSGPINPEIIQKSDVKLTLKWTDQSNREDGYKIDRKVGDQDWETAYKVLSANTEKWSDQNPVYGKINRYKIYAYKGNHSSSSITTNINNIISKPTNFSAEKIDYQTISLEWQDNCSFEEGFKIERKLSGGEYQVITDEIFPNKTSYTDRNLEQNYSYKYRISAYTDKNQSEYSEIGPIDLEN